MEAYGAFGFEGLGAGGIVWWKFYGAGVEGGEKGLGEAEFCHVYCRQLSLFVSQADDAGLLCYYDAWIINNLAGAWMTLNLTLPLGSPCRAV